MPESITIGYGDAAGYSRTDAGIRDAAHAHDDRHRGEGVEIGIAGLPDQVRHHEDGAERNPSG